MFTARHQWQMDLAKPQADIIGPHGLVTIDDVFADNKLDTSDPSDKLLHPKIEFRSLFMSDLHFGTLSSAAGEATQFINHTTGLEYLYLVGDLFDLVKLNISKSSQIGGLLNKSMFSQAESTFSQKVQRASRKGTKVVLIPGNHDECLRDFADRFIGNIVIKFQAVHSTVDNRHLLVLHGDSFDELVRWPWLEYFGTHAFEAATKLGVQLDKLRKNHRLNKIFEKFGLKSNWSLAQAIRNNMDGKAYNDKYRRAMLTYLFTENADIFSRHKNAQNDFKEIYLDGVIGGHTHIVDKRQYASPVDQTTGEKLGPSVVTYYNTGHWTVSPKLPNVSSADYEADQAKYPTFTALAEYPDGHMGHVQWVPGKGIVPMTCFDNNDISVMMPAIQPVSKAEYAIFMRPNKKQKQPAEAQKYG